MIQRPPRLWVWVRLLAANVLGFAVLCALVEGGVRLAYPQLGPLGTEGSLIAPERYGPTAGLRPGASGHTNGAAVQVDARGLWRYAGAHPDRPGWLFLGDSVTMGLGVPSDSTFAGRVAAAQDTLDVRNPSLVGYSSADYARVLDAWLDVPGGPPLVRVSVFWTLNDVYADLPVATAPEGTRRIPTGLHRFVLRHVRTYQWLRTALFDRPQAYYDHDRQFYAAADPHLQAALGHLTAMAAACRQRGVPFEVVLLPYAAQLTSGDDLPQRVMKARLGAQGIAVRDVLPPFRASGAGRGLFLYGDGIHLSTAGHARVAALLASDGRGL